MRKTNKQFVDDVNTLERVNDKNKKPKLFPFTLLEERSSFFKTFDSLVKVFSSSYRFGLEVLGNKKVGNLWSSLYNS